MKQPHKVTEIYKMLKTLCRVTMMVSRQSKPREGKSASSNNPHWQVYYDDIFSATVDFIFERSKLLRQLVHTVPMKMTQKIGNRYGVVTIDLILAEHAINYLKIDEQSKYYLHLPTNHGSVLHDQMTL